jgi:hypothetical protein
MSGASLAGGYDGAFNLGGAMHPEIKKHLKHISLSCLPGNYRGMALKLLRQFDKKKFECLVNCLPPGQRRWDLLDLA